MFFISLYADSLINHNRLLGLHKGVPGQFYAPPACPHYSGESNLHGLLIWFCLGFRSNQLTQTVCLSASPATLNVVVGVFIFHFLAIADN